MTITADTANTLAARYPALRSPCPYCDGRGLDMNISHDVGGPVGCPDCRGLGYVPRVDIGAMLEVCKALSLWVSYLEWATYDAAWRCTLAHQHKDDEYRGAGATPEEALSSALLALPVTVTVTPKPQGVGDEQAQR